MTISLGTAWIIAGIILILVELLLTSIIAVFFGIAAIVVGLLIHMSLLESHTAQFITFSFISVTLLFGIRKRFKQWFTGNTLNDSVHSSDIPHDISDRVVVVADFSNGFGRVILNGVQWSAKSSENLKKGHVAWVTHNDGITLIVSSVKS